MAVCLACGTENVEDESLCVDCGTPLAIDHQYEIRRFATVVNSDLKGSTALGERLDPESLRELLTRRNQEIAQENAVRRSRVLLTVTSVH